MRTLIAIFILTNLCSCSNKQSNNLDVKNKDIDKNHLTISVIDSKFPLSLDKISLKEKNNLISLNDGINAKIEETIKKHAEEFYDNSQTYKDTYINTIRLKDSLQTIFLVLLKHYPTQEVNSKILFYDNLKKEFVDKEFEFKLYALYDYNNKKLTPTNLKTDFKLNFPEIEIMDFNKDGINDYKFKRLWHNGTFNSIHTTILTIKNSSIDTLYFCEEELGELAKKKNCL